MQIIDTNNYDIFKICRAQISFNCFYTTPEGITGTWVNRSKLELQQRAAFLTSATKAFILASNLFHMVKKSSENKPSCYIFHLIELLIYTQAFLKLSALCISLIIRVNSTLIAWHFSKYYLAILVFKNQWSFSQCLKNSF